MKKNRQTSGKKILITQLSLTRAKLKMLKVPGSLEVPHRDKITGNKAAAEDYSLLFRSINQQFGL